MFVEQPMSFVNISQNVQNEPVDALDEIPDEAMLQAVAVKKTKISIHWLDLFV